jgi:hypothetical protein
MPGRFRVRQPESLPPVRVSNCLSTIAVMVGLPRVVPSSGLCDCCPYHDSRFALNDGRVINRPAVHPQLASRQG